MYSNEQKGEEKTNTVTTDCILTTSSTKQQSMDGFQSGVQTTKREVISTEAL